MVICDSTSIRSYVATFEIVFFTELQKGISYTAFEEQCESYSAMKVDQLENLLLRKWPLNILVSREELLFVYTHSGSFTPF